MVNVIFKKKFGRNVIMALKRAAYVSESAVFKRPNVSKVKQWDL